MPSFFAPGSSSTGGTSRKTKAKQPPNSLVHVFRDEWTDDWVEVADQLCTLLDLPDMTTRSGLKKVHACLPSIQERLDETFKFAKRTRQTKAMGGVVAIYSKMCSLDAVLQNKLLENGFYSLLATLSEYDDTRSLALRALNLILLSASSHRNLPLGFLRAAPSVLKPALKHLDDPTTISLVAHVIAHSPASLQRDLESALDVSAFGRLLLDALKQPTATEGLLHHTLTCLSSSTFKMWEKRDGIPGLLGFYVALLRSTNLRLRVTALRMVTTQFQFWDMHPTEPEQNRGTVAVVSGSPKCKRGCISSANIARNVKFEDLPPKLLQIADRYGKNKTHLVALQRARAAYAGIFLQYSVENDLLDIARALSRLIYQYRFALPERLAPATGAITTCRDCATQAPWQNLICKCVKALRDQPALSAEDSVAADILDWKIYSEWHAASCLSEFCKEALERNPTCPLLYYLPNRAAPGEMYTEDFLRRAKKGLMCPNIPDWLRFELLWQAASAGLQCGVKKAGDREGMADAHLFLSTARADAKRLIDEMPPDAPRRCSALVLYVWTHLALEGPSCDFEDPSIQHALDEMGISSQFMEFMDHPVPDRGYMALLSKTRELLPGAVKEWAELLQRSSEWYAADDQHHHHETDDALMQWVHRFESAEEEVAALTRKEQEPKTMVMIAGQVPMMLCSWCKGPSAALKKCAGCGKERYCDTACQRNHWKTHKLECKKGKLEVATITTSS